MKKMKLLTSTALLGMTAGIVLPMVTSCNKTEATGKVKFRLAEGVTATADEFKVGDKVVIKYGILDSNKLVTGDCITVKFDGWKVKPSSKTYRYDTDKQTITIFSAPTTDITVRIKTVEAEEVTSWTVSIQTSTDYQIYDGCGNPIDSWEKTFVDGTTYGQAIMNMTAVSTKTDAIYEFSGWVDSHLQRIDENSTIWTNTVLVPTFTQYEPQTSADNVLKLKIAPYKVTEANADYEYKLGRFTDTTNHYFETVESIYESADPTSKSLGDVVTALQNDGRLVSINESAFEFAGLVESDGTEITDWKSIKVSDYLTSHTTDKSLYFLFTLRDDWTSNLAKLNWDSELNCFWCYGSSQWDISNPIDVIVDTREIPDSSMNDKQRIFIYSCFMDGTSVQPINFYSDDIYAEGRPVPGVEIYSSTGLNIQLVEETCYWGGTSYLRYYLAYFDEDGTEHPFITWNDIKSLGILYFYEVYLKPNYDPANPLVLSAWPQE